MILDITPVPKPRMTRADRWKKRQSVLKFFAFRDAVRQSKGPFFASPDGGVHNRVFEFESFKIVFHVPMPKSWSKKKKAQFEGKPHQQRPDLDNYLKAWKDSVYEEDAVVWHVEATKLWTSGPGYIMVIQT